MGVAIRVGLKALQLLRGPFQARTALVEKIAVANAEEIRAREQELAALFGERKGEAPRGKGQSKG